MGFKFNRNITEDEMIEVKCYRCLASEKCSSQSYYDAPPFFCGLRKNRTPLSDHFTGRSLLACKRVKQTLFLLVCKRMVCCSRAADSVETRGKVMT